MGALLKAGVALVGSLFLKKAYDKYWKSGIVQAKASTLLNDLAEKPIVKENQVLNDVVKAAKDAIPSTPETSEVTPTTATVEVLPASNNPTGIP